MTITEAELERLERAAAHLEQALGLTRPLRRYRAGSDGAMRLDLEALAERLEKLSGWLTRDDG